MQIQCSACAHAFSPRRGQRVPPWCPMCGADLVAYKDAGPETQVSQDPDTAQQESVAESLRERFTKHNLAVGLLLAVWGLLVGLRGQPSELDKLLSLQPGLPILMAVLQWAMLANGALLFCSGLAVRARHPWGPYAAAASAVLSILAGCVFFGVFWHLGNYQGLENSVGRVTFATTNLDLIAGFVDGFGLLVFLNLYRAAAGFPAPPSPRSASATS